MSTTKDLEVKLDEIVNKKAPQLPLGIKNFLHDWAPWIALVVGILNLLSAWGLWRAARPSSNTAYYIQQICSTYQSDGHGGCALPTTYSHLTFWVWLAVIFLVIQAVLYLRAFPRLREQQKSGWDLLYFAVLVNVAYAIITLLIGFDVVGHFISAAIGAALSFYLLFQIRSFYTSSPVISAETKPDVPAPTPEPKPEPETDTTEVKPAEIVTPETVVVAPTPKPAAKKKTTAKKKPVTKKKSAPKKKP